MCYIAGAGGKYYTLGEAVTAQLGCGDKADYFNCFATLMHCKSEKSLYKACPSPDCNKKVTNLYYLYFTSLSRINCCICLNEWNTTHQGDYY
jgi:hypothetical protein